MKERYKKVCFTLDLIIRMAAVSLLLILVMTIINGLLPSFLVKAEETFINDVIDYESGSALSVFGRSFLVLSLILMLERGLTVAIKYMLILNREQIRKHIYSDIILVENKISFAKLEEKSMQDLLMRVFEDSENHLSALIKYSALILKYVTTVVSLLALLFFQIGIKAFIIMAAALLIAIISKKGGQQVYNLEVESSYTKRQAAYYDDVLMDRNYADERIIFSFFKKLDISWNKKESELIDRQAKLSRAIFMQEKAASILLYSISFMIIVILMHSVSMGIVSVGFMVAFVNATFNLSNMVSRVFADALGKIYKELGYINDLYMYYNLACSESIEYGNKVIESVESIEFDNVSFRYPGTKKYILHNCSFRLDGRSRYALIGVNGAGKSTIVKLLKGIYQNYEGRILINNMDIRTLSPGSLSTEIAVVSQDFPQLQLSFIENINLGRKHSITNREKVLEVFNQMGLGKVSGDITLDSRIGKIYPENIDLSVGEWQKLAVSRAVLSEASCLIMDEPTASMDPEAEQQVYQKMAGLSKDKMSILISHRLGAVKAADRILFLEEGEVRYEGSHEELMNNSRLYEEMYNKQKEWYKYA